MTDITVQTVRETGPLDRSVSRILVVALLGAVGCGGPAPTRSQPTVAPAPVPGASSVQAPVSTPLTPAPTCLDPEDPAIARAHAAAAEANRIAIDEALRVHELTRQPLATHTIQLTSVEASNRKPHQVVIDRPGGKFIAGDEGEKSSVATPMEFAIHGNAIVRLKWMPGPTTTTSLRVCGCPPQHCPSPGCSRCSVYETNYGPLPARTRYVGEREISRAYHVVVVEYGTDVCDYAACRSRRPMDR